MPHPPQIPLTPQTDERNFPRHQHNAPPGQSGSLYPKMLTRPFTKDDIVDWQKRHLQVDRVTREEYFNERHPKIGDPIPVLSTEEMVNDGLVPLANEPVICLSAEHEKQMREVLGILEPEVRPASVSIPIKGMSDAATLAAENEALRKLLAENEALRKKLDAKEPDKPKRRYRRRKRAVQAKARPIPAEEFSQG